MVPGIGGRLGAFGVIEELKSPCCGRGFGMLQNRVLPLRYSWLLPYQQPSGGISLTIEGQVYRRFLPRALDHPTFRRGS